ncbi:MAG: universal stress protein [Methylocystis sp.]
MIDLPLNSVVHPTDFSRGGVGAFAHALRIAAAARSQFYLVHVEHDGEQDNWGHFPRVREMLAAWGMIALDAPRSAVANVVGVRVEKRIVQSNDPARGVGGFVEQHPCDLLVLMTHARSARRHWLHGSIAEAAARRAHSRTLFLREDQNGFVDSRTGAVSLDTILFPVGAGVFAEDAWRWLSLFARVVAPNSRIHLLHIGSSRPTNIGEIDGAVDIRLGPVVEAIADVAWEIRADMIVMPTVGREGLLDELRGSLAERVLREAPCPVMTIPSPWRLPVSE